MNHPRTALILPCRNEGDLLAVTVAAHLPAVDHVFVVSDRAADGAPARLAEEYDGNNRVEVVELPRGTTGVQRYPIGGPGRARRFGVMLARKRGFAVAIVSDAHTRPRIGTLYDLAEQAATGGMWMASVSPWRAKPEPGEPLWIRAGRALRPADGCRAYFDNGVQDMGTAETIGDLPPFATATHMYGSVYAATCETWRKLDGYPPTLSWGYNEQALALACLTLGIDMFASRRCVCWHWFKKQLGLPAGEGVGSSSKLNRYIAHYVCCNDAEWETELARLAADLPQQAKVWPSILRAVEDIETTRRHYLLRRVRTWAEVTAHADPPTPAKATPAPARQPAPPTRKECGNAQPKANDRIIVTETLARPVVVTIFAPMPEGVLRLYRMAVKSTRHLFADVLYVDSSNGQLHQACPEANIIPGEPPIADLAASTSRDRAANQSANWQRALAWLKETGWHGPILSWEPDVIPTLADLHALLAHPANALTTCPIPSRHRRNHLMLYADKTYRHASREPWPDCASCHLGLTTIPAAVWQAWTPRPIADAGNAAVDHAMIDDANVRPRICWECRPRHHATAETFFQYPQRHAQTTKGKR